MHAFLAFIQELSNVDTNLIWNNRGDQDENVVLVGCIRILAFQVKMGKAPMPV